MSKSKNSNPNVFRSKWDMPHEIDTDYDRNDRKQIIKEFLDEEEQEENWCPKCGQGGIYDPLCKKCKEKKDDLDEYIKERWGKVKK